MAKFKQFARHWIMAFLYPRPLIGIFFLPRYLLHWVRLARKAGPKQRMKLMDAQPCLGDWTTHTPFDAHYFFQGAWLARALTRNSPFQHTDIGSSVLTVSVLSGFVDTTFVDYRPIKVDLPGLNPLPGNILDLPFADGSVSSLSCLHVVEHIGLGRYGDPIDPEGSRKALKELERVVTPGGKLFLSVPVGIERVCFNAHRVFAPESILATLGMMTLISFSLVDDDGRFKPDCAISEAAGLDYGCGMFVMEKRANDALTS